MLKSRYLPVIFALIANILCWIFEPNYWWSNWIVFGTYTLLMLSVLDYKHILNNKKTILAFFIFSTIVTTGLEKLFIVTDTWSFSRLNSEMIGYTIFGAPIEEYVFWEGCPIAVILTYLFYTQDTKEFKPIILLAGSPIYYIPRLMDHVKSTYNDYVVPTVDKYGYPVYNRGKKIPVYTFFIVFVLVTLYLLRNSVKSWLPVLMTGIAFLALIFPFEQYSIIRQVWVYNANKMIGVFILGIPIEEWIIYLACPMTGCLMISFAAKYFKETL